MSNIKEFFNTKKLISLQESLDDIDFLTFGVSFLGYCKTENYEFIVKLLLKYPTLDLNIFPEDTHQNLLMGIRRFVVRTSNTVVKAIPSNLVLMYNFLSDLSTIGIFTKPDSIFELYLYNEDTLPNGYKFSGFTSKDKLIIFLYFATNKKAFEILTTLYSKNEAQGVFKDMTSLMSEIEKIRNILLQTNRSNVSIIYDVIRRIKNMSDSSILFFTVENKLKWQLNRGDFSLAPKVAYNTDGLGTLNTTDPIKEVIKSILLFIHCLKLAATEKTFGPITRDLIDDVISKDEKEGYIERMRLTGKHTKLSYDTVNDPSITVDSLFHQLIKTQQEIEYYNKKQLDTEVSEVSEKLDQIIQLIYVKLADNPKFFTNLIKQLEVPDQVNLLNSDFFGIVSKTKYRGLDNLVYDLSLLSSIIKKKFDVSFAYILNNPPNKFLREDLIIKITAAIRILQNDENFVGDVTNYFINTILTSYHTMDKLQLFIKNNVLGITFVYRSHFGNLKDKFIREVTNYLKVSKADLTSIIVKSADSSKESLSKGSVHRVSYYSGSKDSGGLKSRISRVFNSLV